MPVTGLMNMYYCQSAFTKQVRVSAINILSLLILDS
jgi:hypothetical protein